MAVNSFKIKYFKDSIIGLKAVVTSCSKNKLIKNQPGIIKTGITPHRFSFLLDIPILLDGIEISHVQLTEDDEIYLIPE